MWCPNCQADVAAEVTPDNRRVRCATCGSEVSLSSTTRTSVKTREARELLERWANDRLLSHHEASSTSREGFEDAPYSAARESASRAEPQFANDSAAEPEDASAHTVGAAPAPKARKFRVDSAHPATSEPAQDDSPASKAERRILAVRERERTANVRPASDLAPSERIQAPHAAFDRTPVQPAPARRVHRAHIAAAAAPHFDVQAAIRDQERPRTNWSSLAGQLLAYLGVALLTVGSSLVLWSYFGGPENYAPTGWLVTTAGQMLLFLGVVTLVSGGMEQTTEEVKRRIEMLGDKLLRFEQVTRDHALRGPHTPAGQYENPEDFDESEVSAEQPAPQQRASSRGQVR